MGGPHQKKQNKTKQKKLKINNKKANSTRSSQAVSHPSTILAQCCLTSVIGRELVSSIELLFFVPDFCAIGLRMHGTFPRCRDGELTMEMGGG